MSSAAWGIPYLFDDQVQACTDPSPRPGPRKGWQGTPASVPRGVRKAAALSATTRLGATGSVSRQFATVDEAQAFLAGHFNAWRDCLPPQQQAGLRLYESADHQLMNWQRRGHLPRPADGDAGFALALRACGDVSAAIAAAPPLAEPVVGFRGFSGSRFGVLTAGQRLTDRGFVSLSLTDDVHAEQRAAGLATVAVHLPAGTRAAALGTRELVLDGGVFEVLRAGQRRGVPHYELRLVG